MALSEQELIDAALGLGMLSEGQLDEARQISRRARLPLLIAVSRCIRQPVSGLYQAAAKRRGMRFLQPSQLSPETVDMERMPQGLALRRHCLPIRDASGQLLLAMGNPDDMASLDQVSETFREHVVPAMAFPEALAGAVERTLGESVAESFGAEDAVGLLSEILSDAYMEQASDIHLQPVGQHLRVRYRVDGQLRDWRRDLRPAERDPLVNRVKVLSDLDIAENRAPQDGAFRHTFAEFDDAMVEFRVSCLPVQGGERVVLRLLGVNTKTLSLSDLGLPVGLVRDFGQAIHHPHGVLLVTGPTGSGKSTTLYGALREIDRTTRNVITVEDPIEQMVEGASQVQISTKIGFSDALRSILRQDPDVILLGEIRDGETADIALKAAQTGHLVFSTLHTNTAIGAITRLTDLGVGRWQVAASLNGVLSQRLVPILCDNCKTPRAATPEENHALGRATDDDGPLYDAPGCPFCLGRGVRGRVGVFEAVWIDDTLRDMIAQGASEGDLQRMAQHFTPLGDDLVAKVIDGTTSFAAAAALGLGQDIHTHDHRPGNQNRDHNAMKDTA